MVIAKLVVMFKLSATLFMIVSRNQSTVAQSSLTSASRFQCGMCIISWWISQLTMRWFSVIPIIVLSIASQPPLHHEMRRSTPIMRSYWMFNVEKCVLIEVSYASRRIPHLIRNMQETFHLRHTRIISPNVVGSQWEAITLTAEEYSHIDFSSSHCEAIVTPLNPLNPKCLWLMWQSIYPSSLSILRFFGFT